MVPSIDQQRKEALMECKGVAVVIVEDEGICDLICEKLAENDYDRFKSLVTNRIEEI